MPKMVHAIFYAVVVNEALELSILSRDLAKDLKFALLACDGLYLKLGCSSTRTVSYGFTALGCLIRKWGQAL